MDSFGKGGKEIKTLIVIASQIVLGSEFSPETLLKMKLSYELTINEILKILKKNHLESKYKILFRHHPRFNDCINFSDWKEKFPSLEMNDTRDWNEIYPETKCLLTLNSTSAFDAAAYGVPTIIIKGKFNGFRNILEEDFHYPLNSLTVETCLLQDQQEYQKDCKTAFQWYQKYYELFSRDNCWHLLEQLISSP
jgi:CDP-glycerol glycerophosphotransferase (TagB/SpsB family)